MKQFKQLLGLVLNEKIVSEKALEDGLLLDGLRIAFNQLLSLLHDHWIDLLRLLLRERLRFSQGKLRGWRSLECWPSGANHRRLCSS